MNRNELLICSCWRVRNVSAALIQFRSLKSCSLWCGQVINVHNVTVKITRRVFLHYHRKALIKSDLIKQKKQTAKATLLHGLKYRLLAIIIYGVDGLHNSFLDNDRETQWKTRREQIKHLRCRLLPNVNSRYAIVVLLKRMMLLALSSIRFWRETFRIHAKQIFLSSHLSNNEHRSY